MTCADLAQVTGDLSAYAGQVAAANVNDPKVTAAINKFNSRVSLTNADCIALAKAAPAVAGGISAVGVIGTLK